MSTKSTSRFAIIALTAVAPFALAASAFAADPMGSATTKPAITDSTTAGATVSHDKDATKDKDATAKSPSAKSGASGTATDRDTGINATGNATTKSGLSPSLDSSAKANSAAKPGTVTHSGSDVTPNPAPNSAVK